MKKVGYGTLRLKPDEFWSITLAELVEMYEAVTSDEGEQFTAEHHLLAWQTALLMNATGNYKKQIKPDMLIGKTDDDKAEPNRLDRDEKNRQLDELKNKFKAAT
ncbi:phage tail assembly chaperone [Peribacillus muralis]|uniref:phage tail assembly chaperone n=1 Tax=Peribacillus muralis TaxID=264697 RepID=UPI00366FA96A